MTKEEIIIALDKIKVFIVEQHMMGSDTSEVLPEVNNILTELRK